MPKKRRTNLRTKRRTSRRRNRRTKRRTRGRDHHKMKGGAFCLPCGIPPLISGASSLGLFGLGTKMISSRISKGTKTKDGKSTMDKENLEYIEDKPGKKKKKINFKIKRNKKTVTVNVDGKKTVKKCKTVQAAIEYYNKRLKKCIQKGFTKC